MVVGQLVDSNVATDLGSFQGLQSAGLTDPVNVGEGNLETLLAWEVNPDKACHQAVLPFIWSTPASWLKPFDKAQGITSRRCQA